MSAIVEDPTEVIDSPGPLDADSLVQQPEATTTEVDQQDSEFPAESNFARARSSYDNLYQTHAQVTAKILGVPVEELVGTDPKARPKPADLAARVNERLEQLGDLGGLEYERQIIANVKPVVDLLNKPLTAFQPNEFLQAIATSRPALYEKLSEEIAVGDLPAHIGPALKNLTQYTPKEQQDISLAIDDYIASGIEKRTGQRLTVDQIAGIVNQYVQGNGRSMEQFAPTQRFVPEMLTRQVAEQLGLDPTAEEHQRLYIQMQQREYEAQQQVAKLNAQFQRQFDELKNGQQSTQSQLQQQVEERATKEVDGQLSQVRQTLIGKLNIPQSQSYLSEDIEAVLDRQIAKNAALAGIKSDLIGFHREGATQQAAPLLGQYQRVVGALLKEIAEPRLKGVARVAQGKVAAVQEQQKRRDLPPGGSQVNPSAPPNGRYGTVEEAEKATVAAAMENLIRRGIIRR